MAWVTEATRAEDAERVIGPGGGHRVHGIEYPWLAAMSEVRLYAYRLPADSFEPIGEPTAYAMVSTEPVSPLGPPEPVGSLIDLHASDGIQLRALPDLRPFWSA